MDQYFHICLRSGPRGLTPPIPPLTVSLTVKRPFFFLTTSLSYIENKFRINCFKESIQQSTTSRLAASCCLSPEMDPMLGRLQLSELNSISITIITITVPFLCVLTIVILRAQQLDGGGWRLNGTKVTHWAKKSHFCKVTLLAWKAWITNSWQASGGTVFATTDKGLKHRVGSLTS